MAVKKFVHSKLVVSSPSELVLLGDKLGAI